MEAIVFADVTDPWAYVGATRFERAAATFTIISGEPIEIVLRAALQDIEVPPDDADVLNARVTAAALKSGIDLNFDELVPASSFDAWRLLTWAAEFGATTQRDLAQELWRAHFLEGVDIADPFALASRAALVGLDLETSEALLASDEYADQVRAQSDAAFDVGVRHLPHVVVNATWTLAGIQTQNDYVQALHRISSGQAPSDQ
jgi:predicted DsbA family dithiol-disulfide isomerase